MSNISDERAPGETYKEYRHRLKHTKRIIKNYLRNGQIIKESTEESN